MGERSMTDEYKERLALGLEFQDYCAIEFAKIGIPITNFSSQKYQHEKGENLQGYEFKLDRNFRRTQNLYIEIAEKSNKENAQFIDSGIMRSDNTLFYVIGDYEGVWLIQKQTLKYYIEYLKEVQTPTSIGKLLPIEKAKNLFNYIEFDDNLR